MEGIGEVQCAFNVLEEIIWGRMVEQVGRWPGSGETATRGRR